MQTFVMKSQSFAPAASDATYPAMGSYCDGVGHSYTGASTTEMVKQVAGSLGGMFMAYNGHGWSYALTTDRTRELMVLGMQWTNDVLAGGARWTDKTVQLVTAATTCIVVYCVARQIPPYVFTNMFLARGGHVRAPALVAPPAAPPPVAPPALVAPPAPVAALVAPPAPVAAPVAPPAAPAPVAALVAPPAAPAPVAAGEPASRKRKAAKNTQPPLEDARERRHTRSATKRLAEQSDPTGR
jgi:hypothetical protein